MKKAKVPKEDRLTEKAFAKPGKTQRDKEGYKARTGTTPGGRAYLINKGPNGDSRVTVQGKNRGLYDKYRYGKKVTKEQGGITSMPKTMTKATKARLRKPEK